MAAKLGAPIVKALLGKTCVPDDSPYTTGGIGLLGTRPSQEVMEQCDTLLMVGTSFPYIEFLPKPGQARCIQIDRDPARIGLRYPVDVGLAGDAKATLEALQSQIRRKPNRRFLEKAQAGMVSWRKLMHERASRMDLPMKPQVAADAIGRLADDDAIICCDSGTIATWYARHIPARGEQLHSLSGTLATMANGLPYAIAAQIAYPDRQCIAYVGDGGFTMLMGEFATAVKYRLPIKVFINKNNSLGMIKWEQMVFLGNPEYACDLHPIDFAAFARACGGHGFTVDDPRRCRDVVAQALATPGPVVVEALVDPNEPPMPGKIKAKQALHFAEALARGTPNRMKIISTVAGDRVREMV
jgi:pyruvate dehydrogenase (quinone)/pyruvate oxidase